MLNVLQSWEDLKGSFCIFIRPASPFSLENDIANYWMLSWFQRRWENGFCLLLYSQYSMGVFYMSVSWLLLALARIGRRCGCITSTQSRKRRHITASFSTNNTKMTGEKAYCYNNVITLLVLVLITVIYFPAFSLPSTCQSGSFHYFTQLGQTYQSFSISTNLRNVLKYQGTSFGCCAGRKTSKAV